jgi:hypothetical protein
MGNPIEAPYEGMRVVPSYSEMYTPEYVGGEMPMIPRAFFPTMPRTVPPIRKQPVFRPSRPTFSFDNVVDPSGYPLPGTFDDEYSMLRSEIADLRRRGLIN